MRISADDFLRPASLRFERGKQDPDARYTDWLDLGALRREVLDPVSLADVVVRVDDPSHPARYEP